MNKNRILKAHNIKNNNIFWEINLNKFLSQSNEIIRIINDKKILILFFSNGLILEINYLNGKILAEQNINVKDIKTIHFYENYVITRQSNGKVVFFRQ